MRRTPDDIRLDDPDSFLAGTPHHWFERLRREAPVAFHPEQDGPGFWCVTRHADVLHVSRHPELFSSERGGSNIPDEEPQFLQLLRMIPINMDPPRHCKFRRIVSRGFTPRLVSELRPYVRELAGRIVTEAVARGDCDLVQDVAVELPLQVICELVGVPQDQRQHVFALTNKLVGFDDPEFQGSREDGMAASAEMFALAGQLASGRGCPVRGRADLVSQLLDATVDGEHLSELEFQSFFMLLVVAGNETTRSATAWGLHTLLKHPTQLNALLQDPALLDTAIEEILRYTPPVHHFRRTANRDLQLGDQQIREGDKVVMWYPSANRDAEVFDDPDRFDIRRDSREHVTFGFGEHYCLGANLARMELQEIMAALVPHLGSLTLTGEAQPLRSNFINGLKHLPARFGDLRRATG